MPVSVYQHVPAVLEEVQRLNPRTVMELGIGFGKWGVLVREVLDAWHGRCAEASWLAHIYGVEVFRDYLNPCWDIYENITFCDFSIMRHVGYDLVMMMDSLEHLTPEVGRPFLADLVAHNKHVIISVPNGYMPQDEAVFGNEHERHLWTFNGLEEFARFDGVKVLHQSICTVVSIPGLA